MFVWHSLNYFDPKQEYKLKQQSWTKLIERQTSWSDPLIPPGHDPNLQRSQTIYQVSRQDIHRSIHHGTAEAQATQNLPHSSLQNMHVFWSHSSETVPNKYLPKIVSYYIVEVKNSPQTTNPFLKMYPGMYVSKLGTHNPKWSQWFPLLKWTISRKFWGSPWENKFADTLHSPYCES